MRDQIMDGVSVEYGDGSNETSELPRRVYKTTTGLELFTEPQGRWGFWKICVRGGNNRVPEKLDGGVYTSPESAYTAIELYLNNDWNPTQLSPKNRNVEVKEEARAPNATASVTKR